MLFCGKTWSDPANYHEPILSNRSFCNISPKISPWSIWETSRDWMNYLTSWRRVSLILKIASCSRSGFPHGVRSRETRLCKFKSFTCFKGGPPVNDIWSIRRIYSFEEFGQLPRKSIVCITPKSGEIGPKRYHRPVVVRSVFTSQTKETHANNVYFCVIHNYVNNI